ncbi:hypothetical protein [Pseudofrankia asymbiotica]|uniref:Sensor domain-containing protein n=1 Tax=Pseudofrankia asymbiotica TaxID=1834516 RepID=A0A1V2I950_9ACTN|nr:hypothetical protein [Pseudofrankia asymbiotica]ONH29021.1 hypothetical protein BL253_17795 [Pseudofrankia asymbiotica]
MRPSGRARRGGGLIVALIVPLVLAGCAGESLSSLGDDATPRAGGSAPPSSTASTEAGAGPGLHAVNFVLTAGPDTPGFVSEPKSEDDYGQPPEGDLARCLGIADADLSDATTTDTAYGPRLTDTTTGLSIASVAPAGTFDRDLKVLRDPRFPRCIAESYLAVQRARRPSMEIVSAGTGPELPGILGSASIVFRAKAEDLARREGGRVEFHYDVYYTGKNRVGTAIHVLSYLRPDQSRVALAVAQVVDKIDRQG